MAQSLDDLNNNSYKILSSQFHTSLAIKIWITRPFESFRGMTRRLELSLSDYRLIGKFYAVPPINMPREQQVDLNRVSFDYLLHFPGITNIVAQNLIRARPYYSWRDVMQVSGIGGNRLTVLQGIVYIDHTCTKTCNCIVFDQTTHCTCRCERRKKYDKSIQRESKNSGTCQIM
jgi:hypothetical protein